MLNNPHLLVLEKSACKFIEELNNISIEVNLLTVSEVRKANILIYGIKATVNNVTKEVSKAEERFKR